MAMSGWRTRQAGDGDEQLFPVLKEDVIIDDVKRDEESVMPWECCPSCMPQLAQWVAGGMEGECERIQRQQQIGQALMSVCCK